MKCAHRNFLDHHKMKNWNLLSALITEVMQHRWKF